MVRLNPEDLKSLGYEYEVFEDRLMPEGGPTKACHCCCFYVGRSCQKALYDAVINCGFKKLYYMNPNGIPMTKIAEYILIKQVHE